MSCRVLRLRPCISPFRQVIRLEKGTSIRRTIVGNHCLPSRRSTSFCNLAIVRSAKSARDSAYNQITEVDRCSCDERNELTSLRRVVKSRICSS